MCRKFSTKETLNDILKDQNPVGAEQSPGPESRDRRNVETDIVLFVS
jgi:hypothetical protein